MVYDRKINPDVYYDHWSMRFWDVEKRKLVFQAPANSSYVTSSIASGICAWLNQNGEVEIWNYHSGRRLSKFFVSPIRWATGKVTLSPDGTLVACHNSLTGGISLWDTRSAKMMRTLSGHRRGLYDMQFSPDGRSLTEASRDGTVKRWRIK